MVDRDDAAPRGRKCKASDGIIMNDTKTGDAKYASDGLMVALLSSKLEGHESACQGTGSEPQGHSVTYIIRMQASRYDDDPWGEAGGS